MTDPKERSDVERLLAETEAALAGRPPPADTRDPVRATPVAPPLAARVRVAALAAVTAAGAIWVLFALVPLLGSTSGAAGAFVATFLAVLVLRR